MTIRTEEHKFFDEMTVRDDFVVVSCFDSGISDKQPPLSKPGFGVLKVHIPLIIRRIGDSGTIDVLPDLPKGHPDTGFSGRYSQNPHLYDLAYFILFPDCTSLDKSKIETFATIDDAFLTNEGKRKPVTIGFFPHEWHINRHDAVIATPAMPTLVTRCFSAFLSQKHPIYHQEEKPNEAGYIDIPEKTAFYLKDKARNLLEERFQTDLEYKRNLKFVKS